MIKQFRRIGKPAGHEQTREIAGQHQAAERNSQDICRRADGSNDVEIVGDEGQGADPCSGGGAKQIAEPSARNTKRFVPARTKRNRNQRIRFEPPRGQLMQWRNRQYEAEHDEKGELETGLEKLLRLPDENDERGSKE